MIKNMTKDIMNTKVKLGFNRDICLTMEEANKKSLVDICSDIRDCYKPNMGLVMQEFTTNYFSDVHDKNTKPNKTGWYVAKTSYAAVKIGREYPERLDYTSFTYFDVLYDKWDGEYQEKYWFGLNEESI